MAARSLGAFENPAAASAMVASTVSKQWLGFALTAVLLACIALALAALPPAWCARSLTFPCVRPTHPAPDRPLHSPWPSARPPTRKGAEPRGESSM